MNNNYNILEEIFLLLPFKDLDDLNSLKQVFINIRSNSRLNIRNLSNRIDLEQYEVYYSRKEEENKIQLSNLVLQYIDHKIQRIELRRNQNRNNTDRLELRLDLNNPD